MNYTLINSTEVLNTLVSDLSCVPIFALDCESVSLGRQEKLSLLNIALEDGKIYLVDVQTLGEVPKELKEILENKQIHKIMFDCRSDADCLFHKHGVALGGVLDMQLSAYAIQHSDLEAAHPLPSFLDTVENEVSLTEKQQLSKVKPTRDHYHYQRWAERPLVDSMAQYKALQISHFAHVWKKLSDRMPFTHTKLLDVSAAYMASRVSDGSFDQKNPYKNYRYMPLNVLKPADVGNVTCVECGIKLSGASFSKIQMKKKIQKCVVCKAVKLEMETWKKWKHTREGTKGITGKKRNADIEAQGRRKKGKYK